MKRLLLVFVALLPGLTSGAPLFDDDSIVDVELRGPLDSLIRNTRKRDERPFTLSVAGRKFEIGVRVRGKSRVALCRFPPLRLDFSGADTQGSLFEGQGRLKLVTHCKADSSKAENNVLDEFTAYRIFSLISTNSFRVRLLRIRYVDDDGRQKDLDHSYFGFLIESHDALAERLGGSVAVLDGILYSTLDDRQTARMNVFQYLIGNGDWSFVRARGEDECCHNIDLVAVDDGLLPVPYDFDQSGIVDAGYAAASPGTRAREVTERRYAGYCATAIESVAAALEEIRRKEADIVAVAADVPDLKESYADKRVKFVREFFEQAGNPAELIDEFSRRCVGRK